MAQPKLNGLHGYVTAEEPVNQESVLPLTPEEGSYGPFQPNVPCEVPIWMAMFLHKSNKCRILVPPWMHADDERDESGRVLLDVHGEIKRPGLATRLERERTQADAFQDLPEYYVEISHILLRQATSIFKPDTMQVRNLIETIKAARYHKIESGLKKVERAITIKLNNLSASECNMIRLLFRGTMNMFLQLGKHDRMYQSASANASLSMSL